MTDFNWSDAEIERLWEELESGAPDDDSPSASSRQGLRRLFDLTQGTPPAQARQSVDRVVRPLMAPSLDRAFAQNVFQLPVQSVSSNGALPVPRPLARRAPLPLPGRSRRAAISLVAAVLLLIGGGGFYLLGDRTEREPPPIPAAAYQQATASPTSTPVASLAWESNSETDSILEPNDVTIAPDGTIWVADGVTSSFSIFDRDGALLEIWSGSGDGPEAFNFMGIRSGGASAFDADGNLYVADTGNSLIQKFDKDRAFVTSWGSQGVEEGQFQTPVDIEVDDRGRVFVADSERSIIQVFDSDGIFLLRIGRPGNAEGEFAQPVDLAIDPDSRIWVADSGINRIQVFDPDGNFQTAFGSYGSEPGQMIVPHGIDIDANGRVFIVEALGYRVQVFDSNGESLGVFGNWSTTGDGFELLEDIAVDEEGGIYISDLMDNRILKFQLGALPESPPGA